MLLQPQAGQGRRALPHQWLHLVLLSGHEPSDGEVRQPQVPVSRVPPQHLTGQRGRRQQPEAAPALGSKERELPGQPETNLCLSLNLIPP